MPPRYAYWTIIAGGLPTAFRAAEREELLPTFQRIREKHPDAQMKWFARGKLWESPDAARVRHDEGRGRRPFGDRPAGEGVCGGEGHLACRSEAQLCIFPTSLPAAWMHWL